MFSPIPFAWLNREANTVCCCAVGNAAITVAAESVIAPPTPSHGCNTFDGVTAIVKLLAAAVDPNVTGVCCASKLLPLALV